MSNQLYAHPDGHSIDIAEGMLTIMNDDGKSVSVPVGEVGLTELGERMISIGQALMTGRGIAEQAGHELATDALDDCLMADNRAERFDILRGALQRLAELQHHDRAAGGFAAALLDVVEDGLGVSA